MIPKTKHEENVHALIKTLIKGERIRDQRSFFKKIQDDIMHNLKVLLERFSKIN